MIHDGGVNIPLKFYIPHSYSLGVMLFWRFEEKGLLSYFICAEGDCRKAPATQGLLIIHLQSY